jgi:hypothetical protein
MPAANDVNPDPVFKQLATARDGLLRLHKALLDGQRAKFERQHGRIATAGDLLQLVIHNPQFDWLHRLSELVVEIDEATDAKEPFSPDAARGFLAQVRRLLESDDPAFGQQLRQAMKVDPKVEQEYAQVTRQLGLP